MKTVIEVNPFECRMWALHDRLDTNINEESCKAEIESFVRHGQLVPALGRPLADDTNHKVELIYGARRLFVARSLNKPLLVELRHLTDQQAIIAMDIENRHRIDISPYERGLSYARWLRGGYFPSQDAIARALRVSPSQVCRLLKLAHLPTAVVAAFENPADLCEGWGVELSNAMENAEKRARLIQRSRAIATMSPRPDARSVYRELLCASSSGRKPKPRHHDEVVKDERGQPLFRIEHRSDTVVMKVPLQSLSNTSLAAIRNSISEILRASATPTHTNLPDPLAIDISAVQALGVSLP